MAQSQYVIRRKLNILSMSSRMAMRGSSCIASIHIVRTFAINGILPLEDSILFGETP